MIYSVEEFYEAMLNIKKQLEKDELDEEDAHIAMDILMLCQLEALGYVKAVDVFNDTPKWYA